MTINVGDAPERYHDYIRFLKKYAIAHRISFEEANKHIICVAVAEENYGIADVREPELLSTLQKLKCDDVCEVIEDAYDKKFPRCYGMFIGYCQPSAHNPLCACRMQKDEFVERSIDGVT